MRRVARAKLEAAVRLAGPYQEERLRALAAGVDVFSRHRDLPERLRGDIAGAREALSLLPNLTTRSGQWLLLFAGSHPLLPDDPHIKRVLERFHGGNDDIARELDGVLTAIQRASLYLSHHGRATCLESDPMCHICPLRQGCRFADGAAA
jgi:endonuclease III